MKKTLYLICYTVLFIVTFFTLCIYHNDATLQSQINQRNIKIEVLSNIKADFQNSYGETPFSQKYIDRIDEKIFFMEKIIGTLEKNKFFFFKSIF